MKNQRSIFTVPLSAHARWIDVIIDKFICLLRVKAVYFLHGTFFEDSLLLFGRTDDKGIICDQRGVFRVNCMDCLDRTNVVQAALARYIMEQQVSGKTGVQVWLDLVL